MDLINNTILWIVMSFVFAITTLLLFAFIIFLSKTTHAVIEFKAKLRKRPISVFFSDNKTVEWKVLKPEAGLIEDDTYGSFIINERGSYTDLRTKAVLLPFNTSIAAGINIKGAALADSLQYIIKDDEQMIMLRQGIANNTLTDKSLNCVRTSIDIGSIKNMLTAMIPHNITAKVNMMVAQKMKGFGNVNSAQIVLTFVSILGAIVIGGIMVKLMIK